MINEFIIKDVRCFAGEQRIRIRPLTFLVGENSTGKSTVLGCFQCVAGLLSHYLHPLKPRDFNAAPYQMGSFSDIARKVGGGANKNSENFSLGLQMNGEIMRPFEIILEFEEKGSEPSISTVTIMVPEAEGGKIILTKTREQKGDPADFPDPPIKIKKQDKNVFVLSTNDSDFFLFMLNHVIFDAIGRTRIAHFFIKNGNRQSKELKELQKFLKTYFPDETENGISAGDSMHENMSDVVSMSPIRSKPRRTYDPLSETQTPEGGDVPMYLMRLKRTNQAEGKRILKELSEFGKASGLFDGVDVHAYGKAMNEPFQLQVKIRGTKANNILDVGYGVSQLLPILVRMFSGRSRQTLLIQQPEVHLHPRGQAELASLFVSAIAHRKQKFIVETHSDYIIDRIRIEIRKGNIAPEDVALNYMSPGKNNSVNVHNIDFDKAGNLLDPPPGYRDFFLDESDAFLGFK
ncbi:AAA family ATPase [Candidatus Spongiihabitans sp.]|uniref:AAA family ATPase n=1 Tax=Candidatus Spongiihabitans sp. TaxID=3101308 RepID=UPI003C6F631D